MVTVLPNSVVMVRGSDRCIVPRRCDTPRRGGSSLKPPSVENRCSGMAQDRYLSLRRADLCVACGVPLAVGTGAWWNPTAHTVTCVRCRPAFSEPLLPPPPPPPTAARVATPGASAQRMADRRRRNYEQRTRVAHPHIGGLLLRLRDEPQSVQAWAKGAAGERKLGAALDEMARRSGRVAVLHDRRIPGSTANIDHIAIAPSGVYVIDAKAYKGQVAVVDRGGLFRTDLRLKVGGSDRTNLIDGMAKQVGAVRNVVGAAAPVIPVLCFVASEWPLFARPLQFRGVVITWGAALRKRLATRGPLLPEGTADLARRLDVALAPAA